jgi:RNA 3'-terminal phosphate cyclase (ATP)
VTLFLQTIFLPLAIASGKSEVTLRKETHVSFSFSLAYTEQAYLPMLNKIDVQTLAVVPSTHRAFDW